MIDRMEEQIGEKRKKSHELRLADPGNVVIVPDSVVNDPDVSPNDLGLYVQVLFWMNMLVPPHDLDYIVMQMTSGRRGERADSNEAAVRSAIQRLADAGHLSVVPPAGQ
ncbi:hypothetical protein ACFXOI_32260 [Streptomyces bacillaris]|uniref:hypothetical protein n=1 Tax=Streptomyces bacillaris TaxID=68179 RepID=UPI0036807425